MVFAAALLTPLASLAMTRGDATKAPADSYDRWTAQASATLGRLPDTDALVSAAVLHPPIATPDSQPLQLLDRASRQDPSAADIAALALEMCDGISGCDSQARARHLQTQAPDNALGWLFALRAAHKQHDAQQATRILQRMARAGNFKTYQPSLAERIRHGLEDVPPPPFEQGSYSYRVSGEEARFLQTRILVSLLPIPAYRDLVLACRPDAAAFALRKPACRRIAMELTQSWSILANVIGIELQRWTARDAQDYRQALAREREVDWLMPMRASYCDSQAHIAACLDADMKATSELGASRAIARQRGKPVTPPATWVDRKQQQRIRQDEEKFHRGAVPAGGRADAPLPAGTVPAADRGDRPR